jgi:hypothetical protein
MSTLKGFVFGFVAIVVLVFLFPVLGRRSPTRDSSEHSKSGFHWSTVWLYYFSLVLIVASPILSFQIVSAMNLRPTDAYLFLFIGVGVVLSVGIPTLIARLGGAGQFEQYWTIISERSGVRRNVVLVVWTIAAGVTLAIGTVKLFSDR